MWLGESRQPGQIQTRRIQTLQKVGLGRLCLHWNCILNPRWWVEEEKGAKGHCL